MNTQKLKSGKLTTETEDGGRRAGGGGSPKSEIRRPKQIRGPKAEGQSLISAECGTRSAEREDGGQNEEGRIQEAETPAVLDLLSRVLAVWVAVGLLGSGCAGPRALRGGKAVTTRRPAGVVEQTLVQSENPAQATKQDRERVQVRTYTVPAGSRLAQAGSSGAEPSQTSVPTSVSHSPSTLNSQPLPAFILSAPMPVVERDEARVRTELGAAQKDTARELGAKLGSLRPIAFVGLGLFVFGLASLAWPPLRVVIGSVTTSAALMMGGIALTILPSLVVGNELLILGGVALAVGGWFLAHRHGELRGVVAANGGQKNGG